MTAIGQHPNKREASRMALIWGAVLRSAHPERNPDARADLLDRLSRYIEISLLDRFLVGIDELSDVTACGLAQERPEVWRPPGGKPPGEETYRLRSQCIRKVRECDLAERMVTWRPELQALVGGLERATDPALVRMREWARQIQEDPTVARGRNCTRYLGDLVIALALPADIPLYTTNRRHFAPLLAILGKTLYTPPPDDALTQWVTSRRGKVYRIEMQAWHHLLMRGKNKPQRLPMHNYPFTLVRIVYFDKDGNEVFEHPLWLIVMGERRHELTLEHIYQAYGGRYHTEHFFRFSKQKLLLADFQTPEVLREENGWQLVHIAYAQLWMARHVAHALWSSKANKTPKRPDFGSIIQL